MADERIEDLKPHDRRVFFLQGFLRALRPVADYVEKRLPVPRIRTVIRPPGALAEDDFLDTCHRCGNCVEACSAGAIRQMQSDDADLAGTPYIDPDLAPCVLCDDQSCMRACTSGALVLRKTYEYEMGQAKVNAGMCYLSQDRPCSVCIERCPIGQNAIRLGSSGAVDILETGCVGCGVCQHHCPAIPKAIVVSPSP